MNTLQKIVMVSLCVSIALTPALVEARAGSRSSRGGSSHQSMGSRGSKTYDNNGSKPIERSVTPRPAPAPPAPTPQATPVPPPPRMMPPMAQPSFFQRHPFLSGVAGGLVGSWLGSMLFNHSRGEANNDWNDAMAASPTARIIGAMLPILFIAGLALLGIWFYRRKTSFAPNLAGYSSDPLPVRGESWDTSTTTTFSLPIIQSDVSAFSNLLVNIQDAWGKSDLATMRRLVTPEMLSYFSEALSNNASQGIENRVERVNILKQETKDGWEEGDKHYAMVLFVWSALDYTINLNRRPGDPDYVVDGDTRQLAEASEVWTFVRPRGGDWLLSAIQQV